MLYREDLDRAQCGDPGCDHTSHDEPLFFHGRCHIESPTWTYYHNGYIKVICAVCRQLIAHVAVASKEKANA